MEVGIKFNTDKTNHMVMSRNHNAGEICNYLTANTASESFLAAATNQNCFQEGIKSR